MALIEDTAKAWRVQPEKVAALYDWVGRSVAPHARGKVFTKLLREYSPYGKTPPKPQQTTLF